MTLYQWGPWAPTQGKEVCFPQAGPASHLPPAAPHGSPRGATSSRGPPPWRGPGGPRHARLVLTGDAQSSLLTSSPRPCFLRPEPPPTPDPDPDPDRSPARVLCSDSSSGLGAPLTQSCPSLPRPPRPPTAKSRPPALPARVGSWAGAPGQRGWIWLGLSRLRAGKALAQCVKTFAPQPAITQGNPTSWSAGWSPLPPVTPE